MIEIFKMLKHPAGVQKIVFRNTIDIDENISFPYDRIISLFRILVPNETLIFNFTII